MIVFGLVFGRWWRTCLVASAIAWPALLVATDVLELGWALVGGVALGVLNAAAGVLVHQGVLHGFRWLRARGKPGRTSTSPRWSA